MKPLVIIGVDPGKATGVTVYVTPGLVFKTCVSAGDAASVVEEWLTMYAKHPEAYEIIIGVERYTFGANAVKKTRQTDPTEVTGQMEYLARRYDAACKKIGQSDSKKLARDVVLKKIGWWVKHPDHINDASRVVLTTLAQSRPDEFAEVIGL